MTRWVAFAALAIAALAAACSNATDTGTGCQISSAPLPVLLYPAPFSTGITDNPMIIGIYRLAGANGTVQLIPSPSPSTTPVVITSSNFAPASPLPLPSPAASAPAGATIESATIASLQPGTQYTVNFVHGPQPPCGPQQPSGLIGTFTTQ